MGVGEALGVGGSAVVRVREPLKLPLRAREALGVRLEDGDAVAVNVGLRSERACVQSLRIGFPGPSALPHGRRGKGALLTGNPRSELTNGPNQDLGVWKMGANGGKWSPRPSPPVVHSLAGPLAISAINARAHVRARSVARLWPLIGLGFGRQNVGVYWVRRTYRSEVNPGLLGGGGRTMWGERGKIGECGGGGGGGLENHQIRMGGGGKSHFQSGRNMDVGRGEGRGNA